MLIIPFSCFSMQSRCADSQHWPMSTQKRKGRQIDSLVFIGRWSLSSTFPLNIRAVILMTCTFLCRHPTAILFRHQYVKLQTHLRVWRRWNVPSRAGVTTWPSWGRTGSLTVPTMTARRPLWMEIISTWSPVIKASQHTVGTTSMFSPHWNQIVVIVTKFSSLAAPEIVI